LSDPKTLIIDGTAYETRLTKKFARRKPYAPKDSNLMAAFIPGVIREVHVGPGDAVQRGQSLLILEAMKMQNDLAAPRAATVRAVHAVPGDTVFKGQILIEFE
jgi:biotin carboxyl carrier protein